MQRNLANFDRLVARRLAAQMWGQPDHQRKLADGIWFFSTPRHGGIIVDTDVWPAILQVREANEVFVRADSKWKAADEQHFVALEEDCDAAIAEWLFTDAILTQKFQEKYGTYPFPFDEWRKQRVENIRRSLEQWNPDVLRVFPEANMGTKLTEKEPAD